MTTIAKMKSFRPTTFHAWLAVLGVLISIGVAAMVYILINGLVSTNLTDLVPWGLWITIDLSSIALSAGAFLFCAAVYLIGIKEMEPLARTAGYVGLIGYGMAMMCLLMDIGRPDRFWHGFVFWNIHSPLWEVTMCVGLYFTVLVLENLPNLARLKWLQDKMPKLANFLSGTHRFAPYLAVAGLFFSMLHQSSLGATYGVLIARPIWYRPGLAVLFIVSAGAGGIAMTSLATWVTGKFLPESNVNDKLLDKVSRFLGWWLVGYLYLRFWDYFSMTYTHQPGRDEGLSLLTEGPLAVNFWLGELLLGIAIPMIIFLNKKLRTTQFIRLMGWILVVGGVIAYRWDTNLVGLLIVQTPFNLEDTQLFTSYSPAMIEIIIGIGIIAIGLMLFTLGAKYLRIVDHNPSTAEH